MLLNDLDQHYQHYAYALGCVGVCQEVREVLLWGPIDKQTPEEISLGGLK